MAGPELECDVIMRGGIASGLAYPPAVARLAETYRFRSIGGTSAGAMAAAAAAAAEYGRREGTEPCAFELLDQVSDELASREGGRTSKLLRMFQPQHSTQGLFGVAVSLLRNAAGGTRLQILGMILALCRAFPFAFLVGALPGLYAAVHFLNLVPAIAEVAPEYRLLVSLAAAAAILLLLVGILAFTLRVRFLLLTTVLVVCGLIGWGVWTALVVSPDANPDRWADIARRIGPIVITAEYSLAAMGAIYLAAAGALLSGALAALWNARKVVPDNFFGLCAGVSNHKRDRRGGTGDPHLIEWLHAKIQELAGRSPDAPPLTVGDLQQPGPGCRYPRERASIDLALMTTDITRGTSHCFPNLEGIDGWRGELYYRSEELKRVLPASVVDFMDSVSPHALGEDVSVRGRQVAGNDTGPGPRGFRKLPAPHDLPIVLGARLSMSFPLLISAVPLYTPVPGRDCSAAPDMRRCWFSDGGLTSNFPIHLFDSPVPSRPTFGISLAYGNVEIEKLQSDPSAVSESPEQSEAWRVFGDDIIMATDNPVGAADFQRYNLIELDSARLSQFFSALMDTSLNWSDTQMTTMPGYRDRIVQVRLKNDEGGYNLDMTPETIAKIATKGRLAGELLGARFAPGHKVDPKTGEPIRLHWDNHRWVRFRAFMASLEITARKFRDRVESTDGYLPAGITPLSQLIVDSEIAAPSYTWSNRAQYEYAIDMTNRFIAVSRAQAEAKTPDDETLGLDRGSPDPKPLLRVMPPDEALNAAAPSVGPIAAAGSYTYPQQSTPPRTD